MNVMLAAGGFPSVVIPLDKREDHMHALESGSVEQDKDFEEIDEVESFP